MSCSAGFGGSADKASVEIVASRANKREVLHDLEPREPMKVICGLSLAFFAPSPCGSFANSVPE